MIRQPKFNYQEQLTSERQSLFKEPVLKTAQTSAEQSTLLFSQNNKQPSQK